MKRERFGSLLLCLWMVLFCAGCQLPKKGHVIEKKSFTKEIFAMDTYMTVTAWGKQSEEAVEACLEEIVRLDALLSTENADSEVFRINQTGGGVLSADTESLWKTSQEIYEQSQGTFDVTIYPVMKAWGFAGGEFQVPSRKDLKKLLKSVNMEAVVWKEEEKQILLPSEVEIDFGGIAKGYTGTKLVELLKQYEIESAMLNLGGNVQLFGKKPEGADFKIAIKDPKGVQEYIGVLSVNDVAVVTSGGYERYFEKEGIRYHHIIDPSTGYPAENGLASVTIVSKDGTKADGYSTALFVMGLEKATDFWKDHTEEFDAVFVTKEGEIFITQGLEGCFSSKASYHVVS